MATWIQIVLWLVAMVAILFVALPWSVHRLMRSENRELEKLDEAVAELRHVAIAPAERKMRSLLYWLQDRIEQH